MSLPLLLPVLCICAQAMTKQLSSQPVGRTKIKVPLECLFGGTGHLSDQIFHAPEAKLWHYAAELHHTLSVTYPLRSSALTNTTDNPYKICPLKLTDFCLFLYHQSYTIFQGPFILPKAFTSCHDRSSNLLPQDGRASTLTTQPLRLAQPSQPASYICPCVRNIYRGSSQRVFHYTRAGKETSQLCS